MLCTGSSKFFQGSDGRLGTLMGVPPMEGGLGFFRGYLSFARARNSGFVFNLLDFKFVAANPRFQRLFSKEAPKKKNYENFYPKKKRKFQKETIKNMSLKISFQEFKNELLEPGLVDHIVVSNKSIAKVYVRSSPRQQTDIDVVQETLPVKGYGAQYKYFFNTGSVESFKEKLEEVEEALGIEPLDYVPITYSSEMVWYQELMRFAPTLLFAEPVQCH